MRTLRLIGMTLLMVMLAVNFAACSNDDDDKEDAKPSIVGTWKLVSSEGLVATHVAYNSNDTQVQKKLITKNMGSIRLKELNSTKCSVMRMNGL